MSTHPLVASLGLTLLTCAAACGSMGRSSGRYGTPGYAGAAVGVAAAGAAASRLAGGCYAICLAGTHCNHASGLCDPGEAKARPRSPVHEAGERRAQGEVMSSSYPDGHEYEIPAAGAGDAGCAPTASEMGDGGSIACEMEGGTF
jgi:hypothetical protein